MIIIRLQGHLDSNLVGKIVGFDEFMNLVIDDGYEVNSLIEKKFIGRLMVKADCIITIFEFNSDYFQIKQNNFIDYT